MSEPRSVWAGPLDATRRLMSGSWPAYLIASPGRSGSTVIYDALASGLARQRLGWSGPTFDRFFSSRAWDLASATLIGGIVYKTHDFPYRFEPIGPVKTVFVFGSAAEAAVSVHLCLGKYGRPWVDQHLMHLGATGPFEEILNRDVLRLEEQVAAWSAVKGLDVLAIRYEALWDHQDTLSAFVGFPVELPRRHERDAVTADPNVLDRAGNLYQALDDRIARLPDVFHPPLRLGSGG